jgi:transposase
MTKKYAATLAEDERARLRRQASAGALPASTQTHVRIPLKADQGPGAPGWTDKAIADALDVSVPTVERVRKRFAEVGLEAALARRAPRREYRRKLDGEAEAHLVALACSPPPAGRRHWTFKLLADKLVELRFVDGISYETVRRVMKKPPEATADQALVHPTGGER